MSEGKKNKKKKFSRYTGLVIVMLFIFIFVLSRLTYLQVVKADTYREKANNKSVREIPEFAPRGKILDSKGIALATNIKSYMIVYNETEESKKEFYNTMTDVFKLLSENKEETVDNFEIKIDTEKSSAPKIPDKTAFKFDFKSEDATVRKWQEIRFKTDRGLNYEIKQNLYKGKEDSELTDVEKNKINLELLKITPEEMFYKLVKSYKMYEILGKGNYVEEEMLQTKPEKIAEMLRDKYGYSYETLRKYMIIKDTIRMQSYSGYKPIIIAQNVKEQPTAFVFFQRLNDLPGIDVSTQPIRNYPYGELGSAFLGYISKINSSELENFEEKGYDASTDYVGRAGLESAFEDKLKGEKGGKIVKLNKYGRVIQELGNRESYPGQDIQLTINKDVQRAAELALDKTMMELRAAGKGYSDGVDTTNATRGAAVVVDVHTGGIIALASRPGFDPNFFSMPGKQDPDILKKYFNPDLAAMGSEYIKNRGLDTSKVSVDSMFKIDKKASTATKVVRSDYYDVFPKPLFNYATLAMFQPGSTFKPLSAIAGLEEGKIYPNDKIVDEGVYKKNNFGGACWLYIEQGGQTHGSINVIKALQVSCNYFFYEVGDRLMKNGYDTLARYAWKFGLGVDPNSNAKPSTGIEISENFGNTSNLESVRRLMPDYKMPQLVRLIAQPDNGRKYEGIDIVVHEEDSEEVAQIKNNIYDNAKIYMQYRNETDPKKNKFYTNDKYRDLKFKTEMTKLFNDLVNLTPDMKGKIDKYDIEIAVERILSIVYDGNSEITTPSNVYNAAIGQGYSRFTPLQLANYMATVVNGGKRYKLHLVDKFMDPYGKIIDEVKPEVIEDVKLKPETVATVIEGMKKVTEEGGTAAATFNDFKIPTGGKTGSATFSKDQHDYGREAFAVYVGFAPLVNPQIAVCVVIFDGAHGGYAAPVARAVYEAYFKEELLKLDPNYQFLVDFSK